MKNQAKLYNKMKQKRNKRTIYDRSQIDVAVDMVMKNKLSLRAASHIYKIPFSTLRTRKIFLEEHPDEELNLTASSSNTTLPQSPIKSEKQYNLNTSNTFLNNSNSNGSNSNGSDADNDSSLNNTTTLGTSAMSFNTTQTAANVASANAANTSAEKLSLQEMREKPLTLHNMKNANLASAKTEALIASLGLKPNSLELKNKLNKKPFLKKPLKKRLKEGVLYKKERMDDDSDYLDLQPHRKHKTFLNPKGLKLLHFKDKSKYLKQKNGSSPGSIKKISKATLKNNEIILSSITAKREVEQQTTLQQLNENNKYTLKDCRYFKCKECKLIFIDLKQLTEHQTDHEFQKDVILVHDDKQEKLANLSAYVDKQDVFRCSFCKNIYLNKYSFLSHTMLCSGVNNLI